MDIEDQENGGPQALNVDEEEIDLRRLNEADQENIAPQGYLEGQQNIADVAGANGLLQEAIAGLFREEFNANPPILHPRFTRLYGYRPRGVILRFRDPPRWTRNIIGKHILKEMNLQEFFNRTIDRAYNVGKMTIFTNYSKLISMIQLTIIGLLLAYLGIIIYIIHNDDELFNSLME